jgi:hypothetical protein
MPADPVGRTCGQSLWADPVGRPCGQTLWADPVGRACGQSLWAEPVGRACGQSLWAVLVGRACGQSLWQSLWAEPVGRACGQSLWAEPINVDTPTVLQIASHTRTKQGYLLRPSHVPSLGPAQGRVLPHRYVVEDWLLQETVCPLVTPGCGHHGRHKCSLLPIPGGAAHQSGSAEAHSKGAARGPPSGGAQGADTEWPACRAGCDTRTASRGIAYEDTLANGGGTTRSRCEVALAESRNRELASCLARGYMYVAHTIDK